MDEWVAGKQRITELVRGLDPAVTIVIPVRPTSGNFLIALARGKAKKFLTVAEDDLLDVVDDHGIELEILEKLREAMDSLSVTG